MILAFMSRFLDFLQLQLWLHWLHLPAMFKIVLKPWLEFKTLIWNFGMVLIWNFVEAYSFTWEYDYYWGVFLINFIDHRLRFWCNECSLSYITLTYEMVCLYKQGSHGQEYANQVASSPPFICGSPPVRAANPLVQDAHFGDEKHCPSLLISSPSGLLSPSSASRKGGCVRMTFGLKPAAVRVEGFDCLNKDCQNSRIPVVA